jgi:hypothetical protein
MDFIDKPMKYDHHREPILPDLEPTRLNTMSSNLRLGTLVGTSSRLPSFDPFLPWIYFSKLATKLYASPPFEDSFFVPPSCLDGSHQGAFIAHKTTNVEYLWP